MIDQQGRVDHVISLMAETEPDAIEQAKLLTALYEVELRDGRRVVTRLQQKARSTTAFSPASMPTYSDQ